jgi:transposase
MLMPLRRRTVAPRGVTPVLPAWDRRDRLSAISAVTLSPRRKRRNFYFRLLPENRNVKAENVVEFLRQLRRHLRGPLTIVWDRSNTHDRARAVRAYLARHSEIRTERFPGYAPELNPDEQVWSYVKHGRLANFVAADSTELRRRVGEELRRLKRRPDLLASFVRHALPMRI